MSFSQRSKLVLNALKPCLTQPAFHFATLGGALFLLNAYVARPIKQDLLSSQEIVVPAAFLKRFRSDFVAGNARPPGAAELNLASENYIKEEILYREALAMGLDRDDTIVRNHLVQKMQFIFEDLNPVPDPSPTQLAEYYASHRELYVQPRQIGFKHSFFVKPVRQLASVVEKLKKGEPLGDPFPTGNQFKPLSQKKIAQTFGEGFAEALFQQPKGKWAGPIRSTFGEHFVFVESDVAERIPALNEVEERVTSELRQDIRDQVNRKHLEELRSKYTIKLEPEGVLPGESS